MNEGKPLDASPTEDAPQTQVTVAELQAQLGRVRQIQLELARALVAAVRREASTQQASGPRVAVDAAVLLDAEGRN